MSAGISGRLATLAVDGMTGTAAAHRAIGFEMMAKTTDEAIDAIRAMPKGRLQPAELMNVEVLTAQSKLGGAMWATATESRFSHLRPVLSAPLHDALIGTRGATHTREIEATLDAIHAGQGGLVRRDLMRHIPWLEGVRDRANAALASLEQAGLRTA